VLSDRASVEAVSVQASGSINIFAPGPSRLPEKDDQVWGVVPSLNIFPKPTTLQPGDAHIEVLRDVIEDDRDTCLAIFGQGGTLELPKSLAPRLRHLVGELVAVVRLDDSYYCGRMST
jgi:hypothetical protein